MLFIDQLRLFVLGPFFFVFDPAVVNCAAKHLIGKSAAYSTANMGTHAAATIEEVADAVRKNRKWVQTASKSSDSSAPHARRQKWRPAGTLLINAVQATYSYQGLPLMTSLAQGFGSSCHNRAGHELQTAKARDVQTIFWRVPKRQRI